MIDYQYPILSALAAIAWTMKITAPDGILSMLPVYFKKYINSGKLAHVLFDCAGCNAAWWMFAIGFLEVPLPFDIYGVLRVLLYITTSITFAYVGELLINRIK